MPGNRHGGFGERSGETDREQSRHRAPGLLSDEAGSAMTPPRVRTWGPCGRMPVIRIRGRSRPRTSVATLCCYKPTDRQSDLRAPPPSAPEGSTEGLLLAGLPRPAGEGSHPARWAHRGGLENLDTRPGSACLNAAHRTGRKAVRGEHTPRPARLDGRRQATLGAQLLWGTAARVREPERPVCRRATEHAAASIVDSVVSGTYGIIASRSRSRTG